MYILNVIEIIVNFKSKSWVRATETHEFLVIFSIKYLNDKTINTKPDQRELKHRVWSTCDREHLCHTTKLRSTLY